MKVTYDVTDAQAGEFVQPKPGMYPIKIVECTAKESKAGNSMLELVLEVTKGEFKGARVWHYILTDGSQDWRLAELTDMAALKRKGTLDTDKLIGVTGNARMVGEDSDEYGYRARVKNLLKSADDDEPAEGEEPEGEEEEDDYDEWELSELKEEVEERGLTVRGRASKEKLIAVLRKNDEEEDNGDGEEPEPEPEPEPAEEPKARRGRGRTRRAEPEPDPEPEPDDDKGGDEEGDEDAPYSEWEMDELKAELKERGLRTVGRKSVLVARLEKDDESGDGDEPF